MIYRRSSIKRIKLAQGRDFKNSEQNNEGNLEHNSHKPNFKK